MTLLIRYKFKVLSVVLRIEENNNTIMWAPILTLFTLTVTSTVLVTCDDSQFDLPEIILNGVEHLRTTHKISQDLTKAVRNVSKIKDRKIADEIFCQTCDLVIHNIIAYRKNGASKDSMARFFIKLCRIFTDWGPACEGYIDIEIDTVLYIIDNKKDLTAHRVCAIYFQPRNCIDPNANKWRVHIPHKRIVHHQNYYHYHVHAVPLKILHLTDFHFDPLYKAGSNAVCDVPLCCQASNGPPSKPENAAGFWGDYHVCDVPWYSVTNFTTYLTKTKEKYDLIYYTGDIISHKSWDTDRKSNSEAISKLFQHFKDTFKNVSVYAILGNHEPHPTDFYSPEDVRNSSVSTQWIFNVVNTEWSRWLPKDTNATILRGGYYTVLVKTGFRIVALNSNVCFIPNLWLIYEDEDPYGQLAWLVDVLTEAEKQGEKVHILSHIPPGEGQCLQRWSNQFRKIINRFAPIISAQFNGHTHMDELRLFRDTNNTKKIINVAFNAGSFTTFVGFNPNYRTYDIDQNSYKVLDYNHYIFNLTEANKDKTKSPQWYKLYSLKDAYGLKNTTYEGWEDLIGRMSKNKTLIQQYYRYQGRESIPWLSQKCDDVCLQRTLCTITAVETNQAIQCQHIKKKVVKHTNGV